MQDEDPSIDIEQTLLDINQKLGKVLEIDSKLDKVIRDVAQLQKSADTLYEDRSILEKIEMAINEFRQRLDYSLQNHAKGMKEVQLEIADQTNHVSDRVDKVKEAIVDSVEKKKDVIIIKETFWTRFFGRKFSKPSQGVINSNKRG